jgi:elongator complex protein 5
MVDSVKRSLRDGAAQYEQPPVVVVRDTVTTTGGAPVLRHLLRSVWDNISKGLSQAKGVVVVALSEPPEVYSNLLRPELESNGHPPSWFRQLDCYTDPLGWEGELASPVQSDKTSFDSLSSPAVHRSIHNLQSLYAPILELGSASVYSSKTDRFVVFFDSISVLLRHHSIATVMLFFSALKGHEQVSAVAGLVHADLHEPEIMKSFTYMSSTTIALERYFNPESEREEGEVVRIRQKRRNGRVREQVERVYFTAGGLSFGPVEKPQPAEVVIGKVSASKVQFNLSLTEKELEDRSKVILPFEHQGNGQEEKIYDGRANIKMSYLASQVRDSAVLDDGEGRERNLSTGRENIRTSVLATEAREWGLPEERAGSGSGLGEIHYLRDSDDERPDSDEDPDDDLDI